MKKVKMKSMYDFNSKFDPVKHAKFYPFYTEVIILRDGTIEYATPSHQEKLISIYQRQTGMTREQISDACPKEYYFDFSQWLMNQTKCVQIWYDFYMTPNSNIGVSLEQKHALELLKSTGCYNGKLIS